MVDRSIVVRLRADITDLKSKLASVEAQTAKIGDTSQRTSAKSKIAFADMAKYVRNNEQSISRLSTGALGLGAGLAVGVGAVVKTFATFDKQMSSVAATGQDAKVNLDALRKTAIQLGSTTAFSATQAAEGVENLIKAGVSAADVMGGGLKGSLDLAAAGSLEVGQAAEIAATAMTQFKLSGKDVPHIADLLAAGAGKAQGEVSDLAAALNQSGLVASQFGLSIEDTTGTLSAFASAGLLGSDAGTSFKTMLLSLANPAGKTAELMKKLGISAYDAQGNFVGIADLADQLKTKLGGLTQAQRDQALSQIFGNDAIRAANVLYEQGGAGIRDWTDKVNDAGFASETARTKLDNLSGDVEAFKGAIESAFIKSGSGANEVLRDMAKNAAGLVSAVGDLPAPVLQAGLGVGAVAAAALLAGGGMGKLVVGLASTKRAMGELEASSPRLASGLGRVQRGLTAVAIAAVGLQVLGAISRQLTDQFTPSVDDAAGALLKLAKAPAGIADLDEQFSFSTGVLIKDRVNGLSDALTRLGQNRWSDQLAEAADHAAGTTDAPTTKIRLQFESIDRAMRSLDSNQAAAAFAQIAAEAGRAGYPVDQLIKLFPEYAGSVREAAKASGVAITSSAQLAALMSGDLPTAMRTTAGAVKGATGATGELEAAQAELDTQTKAVTAATKAAIAQFTIMRGGVLDTETATVNWEAALDSLGKAQKGHTRSLNVSTDAGRTNRLSIRDAVAAMDQKATADFKATEKSKGLKAATDEATRRLAEHRHELIENAVKAGYNRREVTKMIDGMLLTPKELKTKIKTEDMDKVQAQIKELKRKIKELEDKSVNVGVDINFSANELTKKLYAKYGKGAKIPGLVEGGPVQNLSGQGQKGKDTEPILAAYGEHMLTSREVDSVGGHAAVYRMRGAMRRGELRGFQHGGAVIREIDVHGAASRLPSDAAMQGVTSAAARSAANVGVRFARELSARFLDSANKLLDQGFARIDVSRPHAWTTFRGHTFTNLAAATLRATEKDAGHTFVIFQGGNRPTTSYSGSTHNKDAIDARVDGALIRAGIHHGLKLWDRTGKGNWVSHMHGVFAPGAGFGSPSALAQWRDYLRGGDGLGGYANGTNSAAPGPAWVGERGRELINFRGGEQVLSNAQSRMLLQPAQRVVKEVRAGDVILNNPQMGADADTVVRKLHTSQRDALVMASLVPV